MTAADSEGQGDRCGELLTAALRGDAEAYRVFLNAILAFVRAIAFMVAARTDLEPAMETSLTIARKIPSWRAGLAALAATVSSGPATAADANHPTGVELF